MSSTTPRKTRGKPHEEPKPEGPSEDQLYKECWEHMAQHLEGGRIPPKAEGLDEIISGRLIIKHLARSDKLFGVLYEDHKDTVLSNSSPSQSMRNWQIISMCLDDHGFSFSDEVMFSIISGQIITAHQFIQEVSTLEDEEAERIVLHRVGPIVPVRQRINPFSPQLISEAKKGSYTVAAATQPTRVYVHDSQRYMKKRMYLVEQCERLKEKEAKAQRLREKKEREAALKAQEDQKKKAALEQQQAQDQFAKETLLLHKADPGKIAEKQKKTDLLNQLEVLESAFSADQRKLLKLKREAHLDSPRGGHSPERSRVRSPQRIRVASSIPFSKHETKKKNAHPDHETWRLN